MSSANYLNYKNLALTGSVAPLTDTIKIALFTTGYTPALTTDTYYSDIIANESSGTGYSAGGVNLGTKTITNDVGNNRAVFGAASASWATSTIANARWAVVYKSTGTSSTSPLMYLLDLTAQQSTNGDTFLITFPNGIFYLG